MEKTTTFKKLNIGDTFDFIGNIPGYNSFFKQCKKISMRMYADEDGNTYRVGSTNCSVYHVKREA